MQKRPYVLLFDLGLFFWGKVIGDVEGSSDFLCTLALDHVSHSLAANVQKRLDVEIVGSQNNIKQSFLIYFHVLLVPVINLGVTALLLVLGHRVVAVMLTPFDHLYITG